MTMKLGPVRRCRTRQEALTWFQDSGETVAEWALSNGFPPAVVYSLLAGRTKGRRGQAHRAAVALGLKPDVTAPSYDGHNPSSKGTRTI